MFQQKEGNKSGIIILNKSNSFSIDSKNLVNKHSQKYPDSRSDTKTYVINHRGY